MAKPGRKPRPNVARYSNGRIVRAERGERPEAIMAVALAQPHRRGERSYLAGFAVGRLRLGGMIDERQYQAAEIYTKRAVRYMAHVTGSLPRFPSLFATLCGTFSGGSGGPPDDDAIASIRSQFRELQDALADAGLHQQGNAILARVCIMDKDIEDHAAMGAFRSALNVIANRLRLQ